MGEGGASAEFAAARGLTANNKKNSIQIDMRQSVAVFLDKRDLIF